MARLLRLTLALGLLGAVLTGPRGHAQAPQPPAQSNQPAADQPPAEQPPVFRTGINFVRVDVIVTDKNGNPIADLKPDDFEIIEQGTVQKIETFKLVSLNGGLTPGADPPREIRTDLDEEMEAARDDVRLFAIFLDDYHVRRETSMGARDQIARFIETQLGPSDMVGIMYPLQATAAVRMTRNHGAIIKALQQFEGRKHDYTPRNELEQRYVYYPSQTVEDIRNDVSLSALKGLITHLGGLKEGRKALILVSEGYSRLLPPQLRDQSAALPGLGNTARNVPDAGVNNVAEERAMTSAGFDLQMDLREVSDLANRNNTAIYAVDPRGLATNEFGIDQNIGMRTDRQYLTSTIETLRTLALDTDGRAIVNRNDLTMAMKQIVRDTSAYYLLGYNSTFTATDGKFHEIKVRVKRPGIQLRARKGYWAYTAQDAAKAQAPPTPEVPKPYASALASISQLSRARLVRTWIGTDRGADGKTKVTFIWEPVPRVPGDRARTEDQPARVSLTAIAPDGAPYFRGRIPDAPAAATASPAGARVTFEAPPGKMQLRVAVESSSSEVLDSEVREVDVPDLRSGLAFGTPQLFRARTVREYDQLKADPSAVPTTVREFRRTERVFVRVAAYASSASPTVSAKLLNRAGQPIADLPIAASAQAGAHDVDLVLTAVPPGEYLIEISATGDGAPAQEVIGFRITG